MALPSSGSISLNSLQTEYGGSNPISINEYYRGGSLVPNTTPNNSIPTTGTINLNNFYGGIAFYGIRNENLEVTRSSSTTTVDPPVEVSWKIDVSSGVVSTQKDFSFSSYNWLRTESNSPNNYQIRATHISGSIPTGTYGTWLSLGTARSWVLSKSNVGIAAATIQFEIRHAITQVVFSTANVTFNITIEYLSNV